MKLGHSQSRALSQHRSHRKDQGSNLLLLCLHSVVQYFSYAHSHADVYCMLWWREETNERIEYTIEYLE